MKIHVRERIKSFQYAFQGIWTMISSQPNVLIHLTVMIGVIIGGFFLRVSLLEWCVLIISISMVLAAEGFNTAIEFLTDLVSPNYHPLAGKTKDVAAGAVLITAIGAAAVGLIIFLPKLLSWLAQ